MAMHEDMAMHEEVGTTMTVTLKTTKNTKSLAVDA